MAGIINKLIAFFNQQFKMSVQASWDNHFAAFGGQNLDQIMVDYTENSVVRLYNFTKKEKAEFKGLDAIRGMFAGLFAELKDLSGLEAPVVDVDEEGKQVFLVWKCPTSGYTDVSDTFVFDDNFKINRQNIVALTNA